MATSAAPPLQVLVMGAGSVGCYLGGVLQVAGLRVTFVGRDRVIRELNQHGLRVSDLNRGDTRIAPAELSLVTEISHGLRPDVTLLCVKSGGTEAAARLLENSLPTQSLVVSMQNGIRNAEIAQAAAPRLRLRAGMVPFNVAMLAPGHFHRGTAGTMAAERDGALLPLAHAFASQGLCLNLHEDLRPVQWGKLLLNLNNPVNALSGLPLRAQLLERGYRRCLAALQEEALVLLKDAGIAPARLAAVSPRWLPVLLRLPTPAFRVLAARMLRIDAKARSSMADDFAAGRLTEIDALCGEVVRLAQHLGRTAPLNKRMRALVDLNLTRGGAYSPPELAAALGI
jgi:2-dehydropantoate 2-reductase